jgi:hypothetical protein
LSEVERAVLRRLAVLVGYFTINAALEVVASPAINRRPGIRRYGRPGRQVDGGGTPGRRHDALPAPGHHAAFIGNQGIQLNVTCRSPTKGLDDPHLPGRTAPFMRGC